MKRWFFVALVAICLGAILSASRAGIDRPPPSTQDELRDLRKRVEQLEARVVELEARMPRAIAPSAEALPRRVIPKGRLDRDPVPKGWMPREFNGQHYYDIPLDQQSKSK